MLKLFILFVFIFIGCNLTAQYTIGPKVGVSISSFDEKYIVGTELSSSPNYGINIGLSYNKIFKKFSLRIEPMITQLGGKHRITAYDEEFDLHQIRNYLRTNVLFETQSDLRKKFKIQASIGPSFSFLLSAKRLVTKDGNTHTLGYGNINSFDFGLSISAGIGYKIGNGWLELNVDGNMSGPYLVIPTTWFAHNYFNSNRTINLCYAFIIHEEKIINKSSKIEKYFY